MLFTNAYCMEKNGEESEAYPVRTYPSSKATLEEQNFFITKKFLSSDKKHPVFVKTRKMDDYTYLRSLSLAGNYRASLAILVHGAQRLKGDIKLYHNMQECLVLKEGRESPYKIAALLLFSKLRTPELPASIHIQSALNEAISESRRLSSVVLRIRDVNTIDLFLSGEPAISKEQVQTALNDLIKNSKSSLEALYYVTYFALLPKLQEIWQEKFKNYEMIRKGILRNIEYLIKQGYRTKPIKHLCENKFNLSEYERLMILGMIHKMSNA